ncbi:membrane protein involved in the export of O-antigen and teichoic acid [Sphaerochaeta pleomorpha str. Grapes]|uniref:Membrane protein involved in the export of O-antigen and teichoic acid n=1 Tax=Sphaerochaeta pleomorpha (strain ATCC BAA-1885 / DSM 22778 / Grapes) TaxID=158190 RepID=G8QW87_SPHPG|nr:oligosaccharide flippase family protein [Sphaerochaeta pleomorpha]AEV29385.1 membrane protein involved in the export of O-antigen and teichoic acid [Sphaerochaeta pleomorpha str. Grapes]
MRNKTNKISELPEGVKASGALFLATILTTGIAYITTPVFTRLLSPNDFGKVSLFIAYQMTFGILAMFCLSYGVFNNGMLDFQGDRDGYSFSMLILSNGITILFSALVIPFLPAIKRFTGFDIPLLLLMVGIFLLQPAYNFWTARQRYELKYKVSAVFMILCAILSPVVSILCIIYLTGNPLYARLFGAQVPLLILYLGFYLLLAIRAKGKVQTRYWKYAIGFNLPLLPHYLSTYMLNSSDKIMISYLINDSSTAYYSVAYAVASLVLLIWTAANSSLLPFTYEHCKAKDYLPIAKVTNKVLSVFFVGCIFIIFLAPEVIAVMATTEYRQAIYVIPPIVGGVFFQAQYYMYANIIYFYKKPKYLMYVSVTTMLLNVMLNYFYIRRYGYLAAGYTTLACYMFQALFDYFALLKVVKEKIYDMRYLAYLSAAMFVFAIFGNRLYALFVVRYALLAILSIGILVKRKLILDWMFFNKKG